MQNKSRVRNIPQKRNRTTETIYQNRCRITNNFRTEFSVFRLVGHVSNKFVAIEVENLFLYNLVQRLKYGTEQRAQNSSGDFLTFWSDEDSDKIIFKQSQKSDDINAIKVFFKTDISRGNEQGQNALMEGA